MPDIKPLGYTINQTIVLLNSSRSSVNNLLNTGKLARKKVGRRVLITTESIERFWSEA